MLCISCGLTKWEPLENLLILRQTQLLFMVFGFFFELFVHIVEEVSLFYALFVDFGVSSAPLPHIAALRVKPIS